MTRAEAFARKHEQLARDRGGLEVELSCEHRDAETYERDGETRVLIPGYTSWNLTIRQTAPFASGSIYASWTIRDAAPGRRRTTSFGGRLYHGRRSRRINVRQLRDWIYVLGDHHGELRR